MHLSTFSSACHFLFTLLFAAALSSQRAGAITGGEAAAVAAIAAGTAAAVPLATTALTRSGVEVTVELYRDTMPLPADQQPGASPHEDLDSGMFHLGTNAVLQRTVLSDRWTAAIALGIADSLKPFQGSFQKAAATFAANASELKAAPGTPEGALIAFNEDRAKASQGIVDAIGRYRASITFASDLARATAADMGEAADRLEEVRRALEEMPRTVPQEVLDLVSQSLEASFRNAEKNRNGRTADPFNQFLTERFASPVPDTLPTVLFPALQLLNQVTKDRGEVRSKGSPVAAVNLDLLREGITRVVRYVATGADFATLLKCQTPGELAVKLRREALPLRVVSDARRALEITYVGITVGANFGPLVNEAFQGIFAKSRILNEITDPKRQDRWARLNYVESDAGAGDHNAVIYFDDTLTPVLKTAKFDPSEFVSANAQVFKRIALTMANTYGVPVPADATGAGERNEWNLLSVEAATANTQGETRERRKTMMAALEALIRLGRDLESKVNGGNWSNPASADQFRVKATETLAKVIQSLEAVDVSR